MIESASLGLRVNLTFIDSRVAEAGICYSAMNILVNITKIGGNFRNFIASKK